MTDLVLSLCPGTDLLGRAFEETGFCVVRGGDPMFGQSGIETFHPPPGRFDGVIGGPPCQLWAQSHNLSGDKSMQVNLIPEFARVVSEAQPRWFLMENVVAAPVPQVEGYFIQQDKIYAWELGNPQRRYRRFSYGSNPPQPIAWPHGSRPPRGQLTLLASQVGRSINRKAGTPFEHDSMPVIEREDGIKNVYTLTGSSRVHVNRNGCILPTLNGDPHSGTYIGGRRESGPEARIYPTLCGANSTQRLRSGERADRAFTGKTTFSLDDYRYGFGLPPDWDAPALLKTYKFKVLGNGVPMQVGRALAEAVRRAVG